MVKVVEVVVLSTQTNGSAVTLSSVVVEPGVRNVVALVIVLVVVVVVVSTGARLGRSDVVVVVLTGLMLVGYEVMFGKIILS